MCMLCNCNVGCILPMILYIDGDGIIANRLCKCQYCILISYQTLMYNLVQHDDGSYYQTKHVDPQTKWAHDINNHSTSWTYSMSIVWWYTNSHQRQPFLPLNKLKQRIPSIEAGLLSNVVERQPMGYTWMGDVTILVLASGWYKTKS